MIGHTADAQAVAVTINNSIPAAFFTVNAGERKLAAIVLAARKRDIDPNRVVQKRRHMVEPAKFDSI